MIICIADVLGARELASVRELLAEGRFTDGRATAGWHARAVKRNEQAHGGSASAREAGARVAAVLKKNEVFRAAVLPRRMRPVLFARYTEGMTYGTHVDDALMGTDEPLRTDIAVTVFLSDPADYEGGELVIETTAGEQAYKLAAGSAIAYPATTLHRVEPVRRGTRLVGVTWVQSFVRNADEREILFDLDNARRALFQQGGKTREFDLLAKTHANLLRKWAQT